MVMFGSCSKYVAMFSTLEPEPEASNIICLGFKRKGFSVKTYSFLATTKQNE
jgi:hypothetical protein